jgi:hypothetical protein
MIFDWLGEVLPEVTQAGRLGSRKVTDFRTGKHSFASDGRRSYFYSRVNP